MSMIEFEDLPSTDTPINASNLNNNFREILKLVYPVGSIYMSTSNTNPQSLFGGTWTAWGSGKVPVGVNTQDSDFNTVEKSGGAKSHNYTPAGSVNQYTGNTGSTTLTINQIPSHNHKQYVTAGNPGGTGNRLDYSSDYSGATAYEQGINTGSAGGGQGHNHSMNHSHSFSGTQASQSHLQPYITCYMWKRTA